MSDPTDLLHIPAVYCPGTPTPHPLTREAEQRSIAYMDKYQLFWDEAQRERLVHGDSAAVGGYLVPDGTPERLQLATDMSIWAFAWDDEFCDEGPTRDKPMELADAAYRIQRAMESVEVVLYPNDRYAMAWRDLMLRVTRYCAPLDAALWVEGARSWFFTEILKAGNVRRGLTPDLSTYMVIRVATGATPLYSLLPQMVRAIPVTPAMIADRRICAIREMSALTMNCYSDLCSYRKERHRTGDGHNFLDVVRREYALDEADGVLVAVDYINRMMHWYHTLGEQVVRDCHDPVVERYVTSMWNYTAGGMLWCRESRRYRFLDGMTTDPETFLDAGFLDAPPSDDTSSLPIPSISWWWHLPSV
ncbi:MULTISPECIES: terpene synthase family protein [Streptomyces]|uniref:Terpene cyclase n=1 Tax=Streptomyces tsukubensis (strain DSM 42081 / NBRC 108919 / NRRL 18488 / 9993) TaxID=1114943 RepID=I2MV26_STRT9|nr:MULTISPECIES: hypothetical protein [Streptomyces]AZK93116.1 hypothetical protein B7R87_03935 [Streptomyces tsukubensis]EIF88623.1 hypothetical protein [Streptomyces tsukubensis NRRL18488]MYS63925.1 terpene cyclase [Streptomyces sp. SID5473]QKM70718.1 terpene cyclase [Streptomyces tsukubensis NRRL18488]TAI41184.1 terpene cyclase [Streptomyces tsukubensis]